MNSYVHKLCNLVYLHIFIFLLYSVSSVDGSYFASIISLNEILVIHMVIEVYKTRINRAIECAKTP